MYLKVYANHLKGVQVMATINLQCNSPSQIHSSVLQTENSSIHGRSADTYLATIHEEIKDKQLNVQNESLFWGLRKLPQAHEKCAMKMKERKKGRKK